MRKWRENEEMEGEIKWREMGEMEAEKDFLPLHILNFSPFPLFPFNSSHFLSIYGICRECRKNLSIRMMRKYFWIKTGCEEALQLVSACNKLCRQ